MTNLINKVVLGQFRVDAFIASGGMGTVYRVWDQKRSVSLAMKVLHSDLADDLSIFKRFKREANALKKLAHPNIVQFYGLYQTADLVFLLEHFVDGPSLKDILKKRPGRSLPIPEALAYMKAIGSALGYAHANGVVHCDVKPGNVLIDRGGNIYLTDFGIARHAESTTTTLAGAGTAAYIAPEQIRGELVTPATDVYALGVILFEMTTGQRPFRGSEAVTEKGGTTANERIRYAHLYMQPSDPRSLNTAISKKTANAILKSLEKNPEKRYQTTQGFLDAIYLATGLTSSQIAERAVLSSDFRETTKSSRPSAQPYPHYAPLYTSKRFVPWLIGVVAFVLIGIAFIASKNGAVVSGFDQSTETGFITASPSDAKVGETDNNRPELTPATIFTNIPTSTPTVTPTPNPRTPSGKIVFTCQIYKNENSDQICIMDADGSKSQQLTHNSFENYYASLAPDGNSIVFASNQTGNFEIYEMDLNGNQRVLTSGIGELSAPEISPDGTAIVFTNNTGGLTRIWVMNRNGNNPHEVYSQSGQDSLDPVWSPDSRQILFAIGKGENKRLYVINKNGSGLEQINISILTRGRSDWSPDGITIGTYSGESWHREIYLFDLDGSNLRQISNGGNVLAPSFSPDGGWVVFTGYIDNYGNDDGCEIYIMRIDGTDVRRLTNNDYCDWQPRWGP